MMKAILLFIFIYSGLATACGQPIRADAIMEYADSTGEKEYVLRLRDRKERWAYILSKIESGDKTWLKVAEILKRNADAAMTKELTYTVSFALKNSPEQVLGILGGQYSVKEICGSPFVEENIHFEQGFLKTIKNKVENADYQGQQKAICLDNINHQIAETHR